MDSNMPYWCNAGAKPDVEYTLFRRTFTLTAPADLNLSVSADCRYNLYLDGKFLGRGPVRGDLEYYRLETYSQTLPAGSHVLAAEVLSWGDRLLAPWSEVHYAPAFYVSGSCGEIGLSTPSQWRCTADRSRRSLQWEEAMPIKMTIPAPPMEGFAASLAPSGWRELSFDDSRWQAPRQLARPCFAGKITADPPCRWKFSSEQLPQMAAEPIDGWRVLAADNAEILPSNGASWVRFLPGKGRLLLDLGKYYTHILVMKGEGGAGLCRIAYAETLRTEDGNRDADVRRPGIYCVDENQALRIPDGWPTFDLSRRLVVSGTCGRAAVVLVPDPGKLQLVDCGTARPLVRSEGEKCAEVQLHLPKYPFEGDARPELIFHAPGKAQAWCDGKRIEVDALGNGFWRCPVESSGIYRVELQ